MLDQNNINLNKKRSAIWKVSSKEFKEVVKSKETFTEILQHFGIKMHGANNKTLKERIEYEGIDIQHIIEARKRINKEQLKRNHENNTRSLEDILVKNSTYDKTHHLKMRLFKEGLLKNECAICKITNSWNGKELSLHLDHIDGDRHNNLLSNLRLLCPNCHSQTDTYCGKAKRKYYYCKGEKCGKQITKVSNSGYCKSCSNKYRDNFDNRKVKDRPTRLQLIDLILHKSFVQIGESYNVSDNAVRKWCKSYGLPHRTSDIKAQKEQLLKELEEASTHV